MGLGELPRLGPSFAAYLLSFTMLGTFWLAQHTLLGILGRCGRTLTWINLGFLFAVSLLPFSVALRGTFVPGDAWQARSRLTTFRRRILLAQSLYALAALICLISTPASVIRTPVVRDLGHPGGAAASQRSVMMVVTGSLKRRLA
jgi:uncharacterized membrane protein